MIPSQPTLWLPAPVRDHPGRPLVLRLARFGVSGVATTLVAYAIFVGFIRLGLHYLVANTLAWVLSLAMGFLLNRRFTFGFRGPENIRRQLTLFLAGSALQYLLGSALYLLLIGRMGMAATPAFVCNLMLTACFGFLFQNFAAFRR